MLRREHHEHSDGLWWAATTVTTVGYGDRYLVTGLGRLVAVALMLVVRRPRPSPPARPRADTASCAGSLVECA